MKMIMASDVWRFSKEPFSAYRADLVFGANKSDHQFLRVEGILPDKDGILPTDQFRIIRTSAGEVVIAAGADSTERCLLFVHADGGVRGDVRLLPESTTAKILSECAAGNACDSTVAVAALMQEGEEVVFEAWGRSMHNVICYSLVGGDITKTRYTQPEWVSFQNAQAPLDGAEAL